jgi:MoaA/NifB/PqqE/SkfB family radical SAM enzyme/GT2 family glycosyltransferase
MSELATEPVGEQAESRPATLSLSVVIPSYRSASLERALAALDHLDAAEVVVIDSSPSQPAIANPKATLTHVGRRLTPGAARNLGAQRATRGSYLLFLDSDVVLSASALEWLAAFLREPVEPIVSGLYDPSGSPGGFFSKLQDLILWERRAEGSTPAPLLSSSHLLISRKAFQELGGFHEGLWSYEDVEFLARCRHWGYAPSVNPTFQAIHLKRYGLATLLADYARKTFNAFIARRRFPRLFRQVPAYVGAGLAASWLSGALLLASLCGVLLSLLPGWIPLACLGGFLGLSAPVIGRIARRESLGFRCRALLFWPLLGSAIAGATAAALAAWALGSVRRLVVFGWDLLRAAKRVLIRTGLPVQIIAYVTARCNLRCEHCFYKETLDAPNPGELPMAVFDRTTKSIGPVLWFSLGGGEPFLRRDLADLIGLIQRNCRPKVFSFPTNGWYTEKTFETTLRVLQRMDGGTLILFFSLDGPKEIHDAIRGPGSFDRVQATMERLRPLTALYPSLYLNVITTVTEQNAHAAPSFIDDLVREFRPSAISINLFRYHALEHPPLPATLLEGYRQAVATYERHLRTGALSHYGFFGGRVLLWKEVLQKDLIYRVAKRGEFVTPCTAGTLSYVIMEDGRLQPCEILPDTLGNVTDPQQTFTELVHSKKARVLRQWISDTHCKCTYECAMSTNTLFSWPMSRRLAAALGKDLLGLSPSLPQ